MFRDEVRIRVRAGKGGDGIVSFLHEKFREKGGPDGGDGGRGGDVILVGDNGQHTLGAIHQNKLFYAEEGEKGSGSRKTGHGGNDFCMHVPLGTKVVDVKTGEVLGELLEQGQKLVVAKGGKGGLGNWHFRGPTRQVPMKATSGKPGEERTLDLELELIADVGLIGQPNAGKSTLLARLTDARPRIADFPFSTTTPVLGTYVWKDGSHIVLADLPGLLEGASEGVGLGHEFLRHIRRTKVLVHLVDPFGGPEAALKAYHAVRGELENYDDELAELPEVLAISKTELLNKKEKKEILSVFSSLKKTVILFSAHSGDGLEGLMTEIAKFLVQQAPTWEEKEPGYDPWAEENNPEA